LSAANSFIQNKQSRLRLLDWAGPSRISGAALITFFFKNQIIQILLILFLLKLWVKTINRKIQFIIIIFICKI